MKAPEPADWLPALTAGKPSPLVEGVSTGSELTVSGGGGKLRPRPLPLPTPAACVDTCCCRRIKFAQALTGILPAAAPRAGSAVP